MPFEINKEQIEKERKSTNYIDNQNTKLKLKLDQIVLKTVLIDFCWEETWEKFLINNKELPEEGGGRGDRHVEGGAVYQEPQQTLSMTGSTVVLSTPSCQEEQVQGEYSKDNVQHYSFEEP